MSTILHLADTHLIVNYQWRELALMFNVINIDRGLLVSISRTPLEVSNKDER